MNEKVYLFQLFIVGFIILSVAVACVGPQTQGTRIVTPFSTPTLHSIFSNATIDTSESPNLFPLAGTPTLMGFFEEPTVPTTVRPTEPVDITPLLTLTPRPTPVITTITIYGEALNENWTLENSFFFDYDPREDEVSYNGRYSLAFTPESGFGNLMFTVKPDSEEEYPRQNVVAVQFWLYSGDDYIATDDLTVTIIGSNEYSYWVEGDDSVEVDDSLPTFPQTRLYFLNIEEDIPPDTWIQVEVSLNELIYEPEYRFVTGIIIENEEDFLRTIYLDDLELVIEE